MPLNVKPLEVFDQHTNISHVMEDKVAKDQGDFVGALAVIGKNGVAKARQLSDRFTVNAYPTVVTRRLPVTGIEASKQRELNEILNTFLGERVKQTMDAESDTNDFKMPAARSRSGSLDLATGVDSDVHLFKELKIWKSDPSATDWSWPLGKVAIKPTKDKFEAVFMHYPFEGDEVEAKVMSTDLSIQCHRNEERPPRGGVQHVARTYHLPRNVNARSVRFILVEAESKLRVTAEKIPPLEAHVATFLDDFDFKLLQLGLPVEVVVKLRHLREGCADKEKLLSTFKTMILSDDFLNAVELEMEKKRRGG